VDFSPYVHIDDETGSHAGSDVHRHISEVMSMKNSWHY
jgi:hypothetical protein